MSFTPQYHAFSLPRELLDTLIPRNVVNQEPSPPEPEPVATPPTGTTSRACNICLGASFADVDEQRIHYRSDWHRYNVKVRLNGGNPVTEAQFSQLVNGLEDSISGSASSSEGESDDSDAVAALVQKTRNLVRPPSPDSALPSVPKTPLAWFHSPPSTQIGLYKAIFPTSATPSTYLDELKEMQKGGEEGRTWAIFMTAGGHFAGAIVRVKAPDSEVDDQGGLTKKGKPRKPKPDMEVLKHKTFHRYTTRRKQGGSQSINDNSKSKAVSAGAMLRRYGEQALRDDIRNLLQDWAEEIDHCERIFIRASVSNKRIFLDYDGAVINKGDERLRTFPFPTRRPTQSELSRCLLELTRVKVSHLTEEALRAQDEAFLASLLRPKPRLPVAASPSEQEKVKEKPHFTKEEDLFREKWSRLLDMIMRGRFDALKAFWEREGSNIGGIDVSVPEWAGERGGTLLQVAAHAGQAEVTKWLLEDMHADPTVDVPTSTTTEDDGHISDASDAPALPVGVRRTAYDLARTRAVRDVFRRCAAAHPDWWDWLGAEKGARVSSVLSAEMEEGREEKKKARRKGLKERVKEREAKEKEREVRTPSPPVVPEVKEVRTAPKQVENPNGPRRLGGSAAAKEGLAGLTQEMRAKVEREQRARAAEARLKATNANGGR
ncbi:uncharacterized protein LAESUDRAFT_722063 [Laetiporus sulphureus 93-53]|uniref:VLRF1 domain-containing protein n=1 Tax=Laetiporus sulphureus 93-53 TaxID=1314785 RepID=A0A165G6Y4_9APHY|nr:uncharacterized protein LAESUDRAFT_722063 [Laetiporus sulphureus 93-53]KZT09912.1 hypothetical protein LAESUDRAFT_722063 [Laetiporus sulphureus 93-53]